MFIISVSNGFGSTMYYLKKDGSRVLLCGCKLSAKRYKTFKGALHSMFNLIDDFCINPDFLDIVDISELVRYE